eukprot:5976909-Pyramimonas_sp.AAC.1
MQQSTYESLSGSTPPDPNHLAEVAAYFHDGVATLLAFVRVYPPGEAQCQTEFRIYFTPYRPYFHDGDATLLAFVRVYPPGKAQCQTDSRIISACLSSPPACHHLRLLIIISA